MTDPFGIEDDNLTDDLRALDDELSSIQYEERPSFAPELRAEMAEAWATMPRRRSSALGRNVAAAIFAALLVGGASVPSARASFVRLIGGLGTDAVVAPVAEEEPVVAIFQEDEPVEGEPIDFVEPTPIVAPVALEVTAPVLNETVMIAPEMLDRARLREILGESYPMRLQRQGVGGTAWLRLWVDEFGVPGEASVKISSGVPDLDAAALRAVPRFRFAPALQNGRRMGTWIEFSVIFEPDPTMIDRILTPVGDPFGLPALGSDERWMYDEPLDLTSLPVRPPGPRVDDAARTDAETSLAEALADPSLVARYGPLTSILNGEAPVGNAPLGGTTPTEWREAVGSALERSIAVGSATPVALLALGRIRLRQGLRTEARSLFERGLQTTLHRSGTVSPWVLAELHFERGTLLRDSWLASAGVGRVHAEAFSGVQCSQARSSGASDSGFASVQRLIAWNYLCPRQLSEVFANGFETSQLGAGGDLTLMMASMRAAVEAYPAHVRANTGLLVTLSSEGRWDDVLAGARRFTRVTDGHPGGLLFAGLALHRLGRSGEAAAHFQEALVRLPAREVEELTDITFLLDRSEVRRYERASAETRREYEDRMWQTKDRSPSTEVNERWVEHMARATIARLRFGSVFGDAGEVWVRFGGPKTIHIVDEGSGRLTEFWDYGSGPDITFVRWVSSKRTDLTPEGRAYVDDLGKIFPPQ